MSALLLLDASHAALVVIPTVALPEVLVPTVGRIASDAEDRARLGQVPIALVLAVNTPDPAAADEAVRACQNIAATANSRHPGCLDLSVWRVDRPIGFGAANNRGLMHAIATWGGVPELTVFHNDDAHVPHGWLERMLEALRTTEVHGYSEPWNPEDPNSRRAPRSAAVYGRIGIVGPISNLVAGIQQANAVATPQGIVKWDGNVDAFDQVCRVRYQGQRVTADFISGFCIGFGHECLSDLMLARDGLPIGPWDEDQYPVAGYEDNDVCVRAELQGWRCVVAADTFVGHIGHQTFDRLFPDAQRGMRNRARFYQKWAWMAEHPETKKIIGVYRLRFEVGNDIHMMRASLSRAAQICDGFGIVLTSNPLEVTADPSWFKEEPQLLAADREMLQACANKTAAEIQQVVQDWAETIATNVAGSRVKPGMVRVEVWNKDFNERDERNESHRIAEDLGADWVLSIDHDEIIEDRVRRETFDRLISHPDPLVREYDQAWLNHWDSARLVREDPPWGDGGRYVGGMHGFRLWRVPRQHDGTLVSPRRILAGTVNGLHCGNSPDHDVMAKRVSGVRFRHLGYLRIQDRQRKRRRYHDQDPDSGADRMLTGSRSRDPYGHMIDEEGMRITPYSPINGIGLHMLVHRGESPDDLARALDWLYSVVDRVVLVWTDEWTPADQDAWLAPPDARMESDVAAMEARRKLWLESQGSDSDVPEPPKLRVARKAVDVLPTDWPSTGPTREQAYFAARFGCEWVHQPLNDDLATARNAGLEALGAAARGIGWSLFMDLDEHFENPFADCCAIRRMADATDCHGWIFTFRNYHQGQPPSRSESVRMARLIPEMKLSSRVHETYDLALQQITAAGVDVSIRQAPFVVNHIGLHKTDEDLSKKLRRYQRMLIKELEDNPYNSQAWVSLALHEFNDGRDETGRECLERSVLCAGNAYLGFRELAFWHLRRGLALMQGALQRTSPAHDFYKAYRPLVKTLTEYVPEIPILGSAQHGQAVCPPIELPDFPWPPKAEDMLPPELSGDESASS